MVRLCAECKTVTCTHTIDDYVTWIFSSQWSNQFLFWQGTFLLEFYWEAIVLQLNWLKHAFSLFEFMLAFFDALPIHGFDSFFISLHRNWILLLSLLLEVIDVLLYGKESLCVFLYLLLWIGNHSKMTLQAPLRFSILQKNERTGSKEIKSLKNCGKIAKSPFNKQKIEICD